MKNSSKLCTLVLIVILFVTATVFILYFKQNDAPNKTVTIKSDQDQQKYEQCLESLDKLKKEKEELKNSIVYDLEPADCDQYVYLLENLGEGKVKKEIINVSDEGLGFGKYRGDMCKISITFNNYLENRFELFMSLSDNFTNKNWESNTFVDGFFPSSSNASYEKDNQIVALNGSSYFIDEEDRKKCDAYNVTNITECYKKEKNRMKTTFSIQLAEIQSIEYINQ